MSLSASLEAIEARIAELVKSAEQLAAQHNFFMGSITELRSLAEVMKKDAPVVLEECSDAEAVVEEAAAL